MQPNLEKHMIAMAKKASRVDISVSDQLLSGSILLTLELFFSDREQQISGYAFNGDPFEVFEIFFGTNNPHAIALD